MRNSNNRSQYSKYHGEGPKDINWNQVQLSVAASLTDLSKISSSTYQYELSPDFNKVIDDNGNCTESLGLKSSHLPAFGDPSSRRKLSDGTTTPIQSQKNVWERSKSRSKSKSKSRLSHQDNKLKVKELLQKTKSSEKLKGEGRNIISTERARSHVLNGNEIFVKNSKQFPSDQSFAGDKNCDAEYIKGFSSSLNWNNDNGNRNSLKFHSYNEEQNANCFKKPNSHSQFQMEQEQFLLRKVFAAEQLQAELKAEKNETKGNNTTWYSWKKNPKHNVTKSAGSPSPPENRPQKMESSISKSKNESPKNLAPPSNDLVNADNNNQSQVQQPPPSPSKQQQSPPPLPPPQQSRSQPYTRSTPPPHANKKGGCCCCKKKYPNAPKSDKCCCGCSKKACCNVLCVVCWLVFIIGLCLLLSLMFSECGTAPANYKFKPKLKVLLTIAKILGYVYISLVMINTVLLICFTKLAVKAILFKILAIIILVFHLLLGSVIASFLYHVKKKGRGKSNLDANCIRKFVIYVLVMMVLGVIPFIIFCMEFRKRQQQVEPEPSVQPKSSIRPAHEKRKHQSQSVPYSVRASQYETKSNNQRIFIDVIKIRL